MAKRQEQEPARDEVTEVAPQILRMELPIRLPGLGHVNCYALLDREGAALVDPGLPGPGTWRALVDRLRQAQLRPKDVHTVLITHSHPDHFGCAARLQREFAARVVAHHGFSFGPLQPLVREPEVSVGDLGTAGAEPVEVESAPRDHSWEGLTPWGSKRPTLSWGRGLLWRAMRWIGRPSFIPEISHPVEHGDELRLADREFFIFHTPGHTADHFCLHDPGSGVLLSGDHVLPSITPHISGVSSSRDPLASFFYSLDRVAEISGVRQVLPAHGHPFSDLAERCAAIKRHHDERLRKLKELSRSLGPASVGEFSRHLFGPRSWGLLAESETYAHLEHLRLAGEAERWPRPDGALVYVAR